MENSLRKQIEQLDKTMNPNLTTHDKEMIKILKEKILNDPIIKNYAKNNSKDNFEAIWNREFDRILHEMIRENFKLYEFLSENNEAKKIIIQNLMEN